MNAGKMEERAVKAEMVKAQSTTIEAIDPDGIEAIDASDPSTANPVADGRVKAFDPTQETSDAARAVRTRLSPDKLQEVKFKAAVTVASKVMLAMARREFPGLDIK